MKHPMTRADWLFIVAVFAAFIIVCWAIFGAALVKAVGWGP